MKRSPLPTLIPSPLGKEARHARQEGCALAGSAVAMMKETA